MSRLHGADILIWVPVGGNLLLAAWAGLRSLRGHRVLPAGFWAGLLVLLAFLSVQLLAGVLLLAGGVRPRAGLHLLYGILVFAFALAQFGLRPRGFLRARLIAGPESPDARLMALLCFTQAALMLRAWMTGVFGR